MIDILVTLRCVIGIVVNFVVVHRHSYIYCDHNIDAEDCSYGSIGLVITVIDYC